MPVRTRVTLSRFGSAAGYHLDARAGDTAMVRAAYAQLVVREPQLGQLGAQECSIHTEVEQRTQMPVAADAGEALIVKEFHTAGSIVKANRLGEYRLLPAVFMPAGRAAVWRI